MFDEARKRLLARLRRRLLSAEALNLSQCSVPGLWDQYFRDAAAAMDAQWEQIIWPLIERFDFSAVLELAPGAGRNTVKLCALAQVLYAIDLNEYALRQCQETVACRCPEALGRVRFVKNDGKSLGAIADRSITAVYCWDAAVHFDRAVMGRYVEEFARVLRPGGMGFVHHSNLGERADKDIHRNPAMRSNMSREIFAGQCRASGLEVVAQRDLPWGEVTDCASVFRWPA